MHYYLTKPDTPVTYCPTTAPEGTVCEVHRLRAVLKLFFFHQNQLEWHRVCEVHRLRAVLKLLGGKCSATMLLAFGKHTG